MIHFSVLYNEGRQELRVFEKGGWITQQPRCCHPTIFVRISFLMTSKMPAASLVVLGRSLNSHGVDSTIRDWQLTLHPLPRGSRTTDQRGGLTGSLRFSPVQAPKHGGMFPHKGHQARSFYFYLTCSGGNCILMSGGLAQGRGPGASDMDSTPTPGP